MCGTVMQGYEAQHCHNGWQQRPCRVTLVNSGTRWQSLKYSLQGVLLPRQEEQTTLKTVMEFLGLGKATHEELTAMGHVKANRGHAENSQYPG